MGRFKKGQSGNPRGRPKGIVDRRTELRKLLNPHSKDVVNKVVEKALEGDTTAMKLCMDRLIPTIRSSDQSVSIKVTEGSLTDCGDQVVSSMLDGKLTPDEAKDLLRAIKMQANIREFEDLEQRLQKLEQKANV